VAVVVLVASLAGGHGDALSDIDLLILVADESFDPVWSRRHQVYGPGAVVCWHTI
jgi:predicted nucleotidyltransferase